ncbi:MAG: histone deacetylase [Caldilineales bacterium]|nr:histone deacetylase [Caldilineales bacterium]
MDIYYSDQFVLPLPSQHRFPIQKYALLRQRVAASDLIPPHRLCLPAAADDLALLRVHTSDYVNRVVTGALSAQEVRRIGFPWSLQLVERSRRSVGGTLAACRSALADGVSVNLAGGTHHAFSDHGQGFCVFNDVAVAARAMQAEGRAKRVLIIDCDVHQGNGTAAIFAADPAVFTFSIHGAKNFPFHKEPGDLDVALPDHTEDEAYLRILDESLDSVFAQFEADLVIYLAGADPFAGDALGRLNLSKAGLAQRDRMVFERCRQAGLPVAVTMSGGYARLVEDTVDIHFQTVRLAAELLA